MTCRCWSKNNCSCDDKPRDTSNDPIKQKDLKDSIRKLEKKIKALEERILKCEEHSTHVL